MNEKTNEYLGFSLDGNLVDSNGKIVDYEIKVDVKSIELRLKLINAIITKRGFMYADEHRYILIEATDKEVKKMLRKKRVISRENINKNCNSWLQKEGKSLKEMQKTFEEFKQKINNE